MMTSALIIGTGKLGGQIALYLLRKAYCQRIFLVGRTFSKTKAIAEDLQQAFPDKTITPLEDYDPPQAVTYSFFCFSVLHWHSKIDVNDRMIEAVENIKVVDAIAEQVSDSKQLGYIFVISNPVDIITQHTAIRLKTSKVYGLGLELDSLRFSACFREMGLGNVDTQVVCVGEHGKRIVPLLSHVLPESELSPLLYETLISIMFRKTQKIIRHYGIPHFAPLASIQDTLDILCKGMTGSVNLSTYRLHPEYPQEKVALGRPFFVSEGEVQSPLPLILSDYEYTRFGLAAQHVHESYQQLIESKEA